MRTVIGDIQALRFGIFQKEPLFPCRSEQKERGRGFLGGVLSGVVELVGFSLMIDGAGCGTWVK